MGVGLLLAAWLAAQDPSIATNPLPTIPEIPEIPQETVVYDLRRARIAGDVGDRASQQRILDELVTKHPEEPVVLLAAMLFHRDVAQDADGASTLRLKLLDAIANPGALAPVSLLRDIARDPKSSPQDLARLVDVLASRPGTGSDGVARLRLRVALLDRLGRNDELLVALEDLTVVDGDPGLVNRLLGAYRDAGRWNDVLRATGRIQGGDTGFEVGWWRLEALSALGRSDELLRDAGALIARFRQSGVLEPYMAERFFPFVFLLIDSGHRDAAEKLTTMLAEAGPELDNVRKLRAMLFGTPESRMAYLDAAASASLASEDPNKIRAEAYSRLLAKEFGVAHDLYRRLTAIPEAAAALETADWFNYGLASIETEAWADADAAMTKVLERDARNVRALGHRARSRIMQDKMTEGIADAEAALAIDPKAKQASYAMYLAMQKIGNNEKAAAWLARFKAP